MTNPVASGENPMASLLHLWNWPYDRDDVGDRISGRDL